MEKTFAIIKPDAVANGSIGGILSVIQENGFRVKDLKMTQLSEAQAEGCYAMHKGRHDPEERNATHGSDAPETAAFRVGVVSRWLGIGVSLRHRGDLLRFAPSLSGQELSGSWELP